MLKQIVRWSMFSFACVVALVAMVYAIENWRGKRGWEQHKAARMAAGDSYDLASLVPPPVPDEQNFAATPLLAELFPQPPPKPRLNALGTVKCSNRPGSWRLGKLEDLSAWKACLSNDNLHAALAKFTPLLDETTAAAQRPHSQFPIRYEDGFGMLLPHLTHLRSLARVYGLRATAALAEGRGDAALADIRIVLRLADALKDEPILISYLVRLAILELAFQPIWEGLAERRWTDTQLAELQRDLARRDELAGVRNALRGERLFAYSTTFQWIQHPHQRNVSRLGDQPVLVLRWMPSGWWYQNLLTLDRAYTEAINTEPRNWDSPERRAFERPLVYAIFARMIMPALSQLPQRALRAQAACDQAVVAVAVERYRRATGALPGNLDALVPGYLARPVLDVMDGQPLRYRVVGDGKFLLYSVGSNRTDDGGAIARKPDDRMDFDQGDWVWFSSRQE